MYCEVGGHEETLPQGRMSLGDILSPRVDVLGTSNLGQTILGTPRTGPLLTSKRLFWMTCCSLHLCVQFANTCHGHYTYSVSSASVCVTTIRIDPMQKYGADDALHYFIITH